MNSKILVLDNYDSFTYNLVHLVKELGYEKHLDVHRNDKIALESVKDYDKIILSPGPGVPKDAGIMPDLIKEYASKKSILGVCLGHQAIAEAFGGSLYNMPLVLHGVTDQVFVKSKSRLFDGIPEEFTVCRYHSWTVVPESLNGSLEITAVDSQNNIMALSHRQYDVNGLQFHPESIMTEHGKEILKNWIEH